MDHGEDKPSSEIPPPIDQYSGICSGDFGLQVAYWDPNDDPDVVTFQDIVAWVAVNRHSQGKVANYLVPVVVDEDYVPRVALFLPHFVGTYPKGISAGAALKIIREKQNQPQPDRFAINVPDRGRA